MCELIGIFLFMGKLHHFPSTVYILTHIKPKENIHIFYLTTNNNCAKILAQVKNKYSKGD